MDESVFVIAETAFNHMGKIEYFEKLIKNAESNDIKMITFQILHPESFSTLAYSKYKFSKQVEIDFEKWEYIYNLCVKNNIVFIPCFLDLFSYEKLKHLKFDYIKIHSTDLFNYPLLNEIKKYNPSNLILETQVCNLHEIKNTLSFFDGSYKGNIILFHGFSDYPTQLTDQNLNMLRFLKKEFDVEVGFADHTLSTDIIPLMAIASGAKYIEKHITLVRNENDFDAPVSLEIEEFKKLMKNIRKYMVVMGDNVKYPVKNEFKYKDIIHKKPILTKKVQKNEVIAENAINYVRSDHGIPAGYRACYLNKKASRELEVGTILEESDFKKNKIVIAIIARLKSTRLKKKVLKEVDGKRLLDILIQRLKNLRNEVTIVLATSNLDEDKALIDVAKDNNIDYYLGDPENVLERLVCVGEKYNADAVFRITGDNVVNDLGITDIMINEYLMNNLDYIRTNKIPLGLSPEIFSMKCLYQIYDTMGNPNTSEYLTIYANKPDFFKVGIIKLDDKYNSFNNRFSIDTIDDFNYFENFSSFLKEKKKSIYKSDLNDIIDFIQKNPTNEKDVLLKKFKLPGQKAITYADFVDELDVKEQKSLIIDYRGKYGK